MRCHAANACGFIRGNPLNEMATRKQITSTASVLPASKPRGRWVSRRHHIPEILTCKPFPNIFHDGDDAAIFHCSIAHGLWKPLGNWSARKRQSVSFQPILSTAARILAAPAWLPSWWLCIPPPLLPSQSTPNLSTIG